MNGITYGYTIRWTTHNGMQSVSVDEMDTPQEAYRETLAFAERCGWTPPLWWQWWRWNDSRPKEPEPERSPAIAN